MLGDGFVHAMHFWKDVIHLELIIRDLHHKPLKNKDKYFVSYILKHPPTNKTSFLVLVWCRSDANGLSCHFVSWIINTCTICTIKELYNWSFLTAFLCTVVPWTARGAASAPLLHHFCLCARFMLSICNNSCVFSIGLLMPWLVIPQPIIKWSNLAHFLELKVTFPIFWHMVSPRRSPLGHCSCLTSLRLSFLSTHTWDSFLAFPRFFLGESAQPSSWKCNLLP